MLLKGKLNVFLIYYFVHSFIQQNQKKIFLSRQNYIVSYLKNFMNAQRFTNICLLQITNLRKEDILNLPFLLPSAYKLPNIWLPWMMALIRNSLSVGLPLWNNNFKNQ